MLLEATWKENKGNCEKEEKKKKKKIKTPGKRSTCATPLQSRA